MLIFRKTLQKIGEHKLFLFYVFLLIYLELIFKALTLYLFEFSDLLLTSVFSVSLAILFYLITSLFNNKASLITSIILTVFTSFIFISQFIYYKIFNMFYSIYSLSNSRQVFQFWGDGLVTISENIFILLLFLLPVLILVIGRNVFLPINIRKRRYKFIWALLLVSLHISALGLIHNTGRDPNTAYDIYYSTNLPLLSMEKFGLFTTMRIDIYRNITGWTPRLAANASTLEGEDKRSIELEKEKEKDSSDKITIEYNILDIEFDRLISEEDNEEILQLHEYFKNTQPTSKNDYTGMYEGYNLIFLTAEGFSPYAVHKEATPTLYKMLHEGYNFTNFYTPIWEVSTSDGEYVATTGLIPKSGLWSLPESGTNSMPFTMGNQLQESGYKTMAYHNHTYDYYDRDISHPNMGYDYKGVGNGLEITQVWPGSDLEMMENSVSEYIEDQPFHAYYMTVSGHLRYTFAGNSMAAKNREIVEDLPYSENAKAYIASQVELDRALKYLLDELEGAGIAEKTLIALSSDHYPYGLEYEEIDELAGHTVERNFELYKNHFILYTSDMEPEVIHKPASSLDIIPTLSNLLGLEYDSRLLMGRDIFSDSDPLVVFLNRSFISDKGKYDSQEMKFILNEDTEIDDDYIDNISNLVNEKFYYSAKILEHDYYRIVFDKTD